MLTSLTVDNLLSLRSCLFENAAENDLTVPGDELVNRKVSRGKPLNLKLAEDVWALAQCLKLSAVIPRTLMKNRKRSKSALATSRAMSIQVATQDLAPSSAEPPSLSNETS